MPQSNTMRPWPILLIPALTLAAQTAKPSTGAVTGHISCADTNAPARMATVRLEPVPRHDSKQHPRSASEAPSSAVVQTTLDGSFTIPSVPAGSYYVMVTASGYLSPHPSDDASDDANPPASANQPPPAIPRVDITASQTASIDVRLERGAAVSGNIRFDDGSPATNVLVNLLRRHKNEWVPLPTGDFGAFAMPSSLMTDDLGHYRIGGLPEGEYLFMITLVHTDMVPAEHGALSGELRSVLYVYSGDTTHKSEAVPFKLGPGEDRAGVDITIPLSKLHSISGVITAAADGHAINGGHLTVEDTADKDSVAEAELDGSGSFHLDGVPEGSYTLHVTNPIDKVSEQISAGGMKMDRDRTVHQYADLKQPLKIEGDIPNLVLAVAEQAKPHAASQ